MVDDKIIKSWIILPMGEFRRLHNPEIKSENMKKITVHKCTELEARNRAEFVFKKDINKWVRRKGVPYYYMERSSFLEMNPERVVLLKV